MGDRELVGSLEELAGVAVRQAEPVHRHGNLRMGGEARLYVVVHDEEALLGVVTRLRQHRIRFHPLVGWTDVYAWEEGWEGALLRLGEGFARVRRRDGAWWAGAATPLARIGVLAVEAGLSRWERAAGFPGTVLQWMEERGWSGVRGSFSRVRYLLGRSVKEREAHRLDTLPKTAIPVEVALRPDREGRWHRPPPPGAVALPSARLLADWEKCGLAGVRLRQVRFPREQPAVVCNLGGGRPADLHTVLGMASEKLGAECGRAPEIRLRPLGRRPRTGRKKHA